MLFPTFTSPKAIICTRDHGLDIHGGPAVALEPAVSAFTSYNQFTNTSPPFLANDVHGHASTLTLCNVPMCSQPLAYTFSAPIHEPLSPCLSSPRKNTVCNNAWSCINFGAVKRAYAQSAVSVYLFRAHSRTIIPVPSLAKKKHCMQ